MKNIFDRIGDFLKTSKFSKEKQLWKQALDVDLTRDVYDTDKNGFKYRHAVLLDDVRDIHCPHKVSYKSHLIISLADLFHDEAVKEGHFYEEVTKCIEQDSPKDKVEEEKKRIFDIIDGNKENLIQEMTEKAKALKLKP